jgi:hypothetical protein
MLQETHRVAHRRLQLASSSIVRYQTPSARRTRCQQTNWRRTIATSNAQLSPYEAIGFSALFRLKLWKVFETIWAARPMKQRRFTPPDASNHFLNARVTGSPIMARVKGVFYYKKRSVRLYNITSFGSSIPPSGRYRV